MIGIHFRRAPYLALLLGTLVSVVSPIEGDTPDPLLRQPSVAAQQGLDEATVGAVGSQLDALLTRFAQYGYSGAALVAVDGEVVLHRGYGWADRERRIPNTVATYFDVASITKTLSGAAALLLADWGQLRTDDLVEAHLGSFPADKAGATIAHLAGHRAGLALRGTPVAAESRARFIDNMKAAPIETPPGDAYRYTNAGSSLLAAVVETVAGTTFEDFVSDQLLEPIGITGTAFPGADMPAGMAIGYAGGPQGLDAETPQSYVWGDRGAGGWVATVSDLHRWFVALYGSQVLSPETTAMLFASKPTEAYGWHSDATSRWGGPAIHKGGDVVSFTSQIVYLPQERVFVAWVSNTNRQRWRTQLNDGLVRVAQGADVALPPEVREIDRAALERYAGTYQGTGGSVEVRVGEVGLYLADNELDLRAGISFHPTGRAEFTALHPRASENLQISFTQDGDRLTLTYRHGEQSTTLSRE